MTKDHTKACQSIFYVLTILGTMPLVDLGQLFSNTENLFCMDGNVAGLPRRATGRFCDDIELSRMNCPTRDIDVRWIMMLECGSACRLPFSPAASSSEPMEQAWPTQ